jgi:hypothetical protein
LHRRYSEAARAANKMASSGGGGLVDLSVGLCTLESS